ncbi:hypothetical protein [Mesorhizobium sp. ANAO-SY3R2]|uniref:hypothetical protein n=1 Tax=Mesorhizobium sp. ANAO-SY3R2 TaxID=3166644 RepID=UPI00366B99DD
MKRIVLALAAASFVLFPAFAADGVVKEYNKEARVITLEDGTSYTIPDDVAIPPEVRVGANVSIETDPNDNSQVTNVLMNP